MNILVVLHRIATRFAHHQFKRLYRRNDDFCNTILTTLKNEKLEILKEVQDNPKILATWLYENQGEMRFGSENRLFLVLVDTEDFNSSWKLKRNLDLLKPTILSYLEDFKNKKIADLKVKFKFNGKPQTFTALTDIIFVVKADETTPFTSRPLDRHRVFVTAYFAFVCQHLPCMAFVTNQREAESGGGNKSASQQTYRIPWRPGTRRRN